MKLNNAPGSSLLFVVFGLNAGVWCHSHHDHLHAHHSNNRNRITSSLASDFSATGRPDVFDSCLIACYDDIVSRYGTDFAEYLQLDGFVFETCTNDTVNTTDTEEYTADSRRKQRNLNRILGATNQLNKIWTTRGDDGKLHVPFKIKSTSAFDQETVDTIGLALGHIENATGVIKFTERIDEKEYIYFSYETYYSNICASNLGKQTDTSTKIYLGWCRQRQHRGNIIHEILHALGFWHEHSRPDRDSYVTIEWGNVAEGAERNLVKAEEVNSLGSAYDYSSIMHYPNDAYAIDSTTSTIVNTTILNKWEAMGQRVKLSDRDVGQLRLLYQCQSGPRHGSVGINELCSEDCPCWEHAIGECASDIECMGDLVCRDTPELSAAQESHDQLPAYPYTSGIIQCDDYCHSLCCPYPDNVILCPETCDSAPPEDIPANLPLKMCIKDPNDGSTTTTTTSSTTTTITTVDTSATGATRATTTTSSNLVKWYVDWGIAKCVQSCDGPAPCGGIGQYVSFHNSVQQCCSAHLSWMSFSNCHTIPQSPSPTNLKPTPAPSDHPSSLSPIPGQPTTGAPSLRPITSSPSAQPTTGSSSTHLSNAPSSHSNTTSPITPTPSLRPTSKPTSNIPLTTAPVTNTPWHNPTPKPSSKPPINNAVFYVDWKISKCVQSCDGPAPCGGLKSPWDTGYTSVEICCSTMSWKSFSECSSVPLAPPPTKVPTTFAPSNIPTNGPTLLPTSKLPSAHPMAPAPSKSPSIKPTNYPATIKPTRNPVTVSPSQKSTHVPTHPTTGSPSTLRPSSKPTPSSGDTRWYPGTTKCLNDGKVPIWQSNVYTSQTTCCSNHFNWDYNSCMGIKQQPTFKWYTNWELGQCVQDCEESSGGSCGGLVPVQKIKE